MKNSRGLWWVVIVAVLAFAPCVFAGNVNMKMTNPGNNVMDGVYVGPYTGTMNGATTQIICDDYVHDTFTNESWTGTVETFSNLTGARWSKSTAGGVLLGGNFSSLQGYDAMAALATQMLALGSGSQNAKQVGYLAYAIWAIFNPTAVQTYLIGHGDLAAWKIVQGLAAGALKGVYTQNQFAGWEIVTPTSCQANCGGGLPQEFLIHVPEGGSTLMFLLFAGGSCFAAMFYRSRRIARSTVA